MLEGQKAPAGPAQTLLTAAVLLLFLAPWFAIGGGMSVVGALALGPRPDIADLWMLLPTGLFLVGFAAYFVYRTVYEIPRRTVTAFRYAGAVLEYHTAEPGSPFTRRASDLASIRPIVARGARLRGHVLRFRDGRRAYLWRDMPNLGELVARLGADRGGSSGSVTH
jgi:hypothetical protein